MKKHYPAKLESPSFQRGFVWEPEKVAFFIDSLYKGYPIGSLLFWRTNIRLENERQLGNYSLPEPTKGYPLDYVLDGQQRITSIFSVFQTELTAVSTVSSWMDIYYILGSSVESQQSQFVPLDANNVDAKKHFPLNCLFDSVKYRKATEHYNVFRNRWCGAYWASKGLRVIPTVNWGDESTFDFCFEGIEKGSVVAVSTYMASEHDNRCDQKEWFMAGYNEMLRRIDPEKIICYNTPFPEMQGNIIHVDYERSSWRYMNYERSFHREDLDAFKIGGTSSNNRDTIEPYLIGKGGGSAYGGEIKPSKPEDERFWGEPGETKYTYTAKGELIETLIGPDGKAYLEIHHTNHGFPKYHEVPHQHSIIWDQSGFHFGKEQTTKSFLYGRNTNMATWVGTNSLEDNRFKTISDFKQCMRRGGEVQFEWNGVLYCCFGCISPAADAAPKMVICQAGSVEVNTRTEKWCDTADEILEYMVGGDRLRDVITQVKVWERTI